MEFVEQLRTGKAHHASQSGFVSDRPGDGAIGFGDIDRSKATSAIVRSMARIRH